MINKIKNKIDEKNKTIIFVQNVEYPQQGAIDIFYYSKFLSKNKNYTIKVICSKINEDISNKNLEIIELGRINYLQFIFKSFFIIKKINKKQKIDYVYFFAQNPFSVFLQFLVKYFLKISTIYDIVSGPIGKGFFAKISYCTIKIGVFLSTKFVILDKNLLKKLNIKNKKQFEEIGMGFDKEIFYEKKGLNLFDKKENEIVFTYIGTLNKERNLDFFIKAFIENLKIYKNIKLYFIGFGNGEEDLKNISGKYLNKNIFFLGKKEHKKIPDFINSSDILVSYIPKISYFEYQPPTKLIEYLACNKPVICTNTIAQKEIMSGFENCIHKDNEKNTSEKIKYFIKNFEEINKNNFQKNVKEFEWGKLVGKMGGLF